MTSEHTYNVQAGAHVERVARVALVRMFAPCRKTRVIHSEWRYALHGLREDQQHALSPMPHSVFQHGIPRTLY
eukprot:3060797-Amphidinium_carterae.1